MRLIQKVKDFLLFLEMRNALELAELDDWMKKRLRLESGELERKLNWVILYSLARKMVKEKISHEYAEGFRQALMLRSNLKSLRNLDELKD